jgi:hypothetical protein
MQIRSKEPLHTAQGTGYGCQIFLGTIYQNGKNIQVTKNNPNGHKMYNLAVK